MLRAKRLTRWTGAQSVVEAARRAETRRRRVLQSSQRRVGREFVRCNEDWYHRLSGVGKSTLFEWLTGEVADPAMGHKSQSAMATVPDPRIAPLCEVYQPKKVTQAALEIVDTPGLSRTHEGSAQKLALIREAGCLLVVVSDLDGGQPLADLRNFEDDLLIADLEILSGRLARLRDQVRKPRPTEKKTKRN